MKTNPQSQTQRIHYINGGDGLCATVTMDDNNGTQIHYIYTDHLGSINIVTNDAGNLEAKQSFDAWGRMRNPDDWNTIYPSHYVNNNAPEWLYRGYTGHEQVPEFALINMNGRMYDPSLGRMCSPDKYIQNRYFTQAYNRYSYCWNNPMKYTDPSGNFLAGTISTFIGDLGHTLLFNGGLSKDKNKRQEAWRDFDPSASWSKTNRALRIDKGMYKFNENKSTFANILSVLSRNTWELPQSMIGNIYGHFRNYYGGLDDVQYYHGATVLVDDDHNHNWGGATLGNYINLWSSNVRYNDDDQLLGHEYGHTIQSKYLGPMYLSEVGLPSILGAAFEGPNHNHSSEWYETQANIFATNYFQNQSSTSSLSTNWDYNRDPIIYNKDRYSIFAHPHSSMLWLLFFLTQL